MPNDKIIIKGARVHNLKNVSLEIPKNKLVVMTGLSGSGKSSLAFDTIYAEGQRRYAESLSAYARQFLELQDKPDVDEIKGLSPTIALDQRTSMTNPRSTVGTVTEIYDYLRLLWSRIGLPHCPRCAKPIHKRTIKQIADEIIKTAKTTPVTLLASIIKEQKGDVRPVLDGLRKAKIVAVRLNGKQEQIAHLLSRHLEKNGIYTVVAVVDTIDARSNHLDHNKVQVSVKTAFDFGNGFAYAERTDTKQQQLLSESLICSFCELMFPTMEPRLFSFNSPQGACPACTGLGTKQLIDPELVIPNPRLTIAQGAIKPWTRIAGNQNWAMSLLRAVAQKHNFSLDVAFADLNERAKKIVLFGTGDEIYNNLNTRTAFDGVVPNLEKRYKETDSDYVRKEIENYMRITVCPLCRGRRLKNEALSVTIDNKSIADMTELPLTEADQFVKKISSPKFLDNSDDVKIAKPVLRELEKRIANLVNIGLDYLHLSREVSTLAGGEKQRIKLAAQISSNLSGVIYVLDEPSIGLHPKDTMKLIDTLTNLRDLDNTVIVVEHDEVIMLKADYLIDIGPGAGEYGGQIIAAGTPAEIKKNPKSLTGKYLSGKMKIAPPKERHKGTGKFLAIQGATGFNLKNLNTKIPLGKLVCVTGVSGSGKSTLVIDCLAAALNQKFYRTKEMPIKHKAILGMENLDKIVTVDQSPIGRTPRSNPATYTGVFTNIRDLFSELPEAKIRGYDSGKFSFNVKGGGRCESCSGEGFNQIEMQFLPDVFVECRDCRGKRYNKEALEIHYKEKTISDVLEMTVLEALEFFKDETLIAEKLHVLKEVGLGYLHLGQSATTLSGGEAQRVKLATELSRRETGRTLYILDEPTTGLHFDDINRLLLVLNQLVDKGNTVLVIEHNIDVIKSADWIVDMGPGGGVDGGQIVAEGTPKDVAKNKKSFTAKYLKGLV